ELRTQREAYFSEIPRQGDIFLDPDTGISTGTSTSTIRHIAPSEVSELLHADRKRLVAVYQHKWQAQNMAATVERALIALSLKDLPLCCAAYISGTVAILFLGLTMARVEGIYDCFCELLGKHAEGRVRFYPTNGTR